MVKTVEIRQMSRNEVDVLVEWAAQEGWNPGLHDAELFWQADPDAFIAAELQGELIGGGAITSYGGEYGFMGFFIVRPEFRGRGFGDVLWNARKSRLLERLHSGVAIGMDGVFDMQPYYAKGGFVFSHRNMRFRLSGQFQRSLADFSGQHIDLLAKVSFDQVAEYDRRCFPAGRRDFLRNWIGQKDALALGYQVNGQLRGFAVIRRCLEGYKMGPLFADDGVVAEALFIRLAEFGSPGPVYLDAPENNPAAMALVQRYQMEEVFGCARMYLGEFPEVDEAKVFGVTTFELG
jgi:GNAT superfamily N-acetyltransferase